MMPGQLYSLTSREFADMYEGYLLYMNDEFDTEMQRTAWFTSYLMNASGNYKKTIKPESLYESIEKQKDSQDIDKTKEYIAEQQDELKKRFGL